MSCRREVSSVAGSGIGLAAIEQEADFSASSLVFSGMKDVFSRVCGPAR